MKKKSYKRLIILSVVIILLILFPFWISSFIAHSRLSVGDKTKFDITSIIPGISRNAISNEAEIYNKDQFLEYKCLYGDSCLDLINVGTAVEMKTGNIMDMITIIDKPLPYPNNYISGMTFSISCFVPIAPVNPFYNVFVLPVDSLYQIKMHVSGHIDSVKQESVHVVKYKIRTNNLSFVFNEETETNLNYSIGMDGALAAANLIFCMEPKTQKVYIVVMAESWKLPS